MCEYIFTPPTHLVQSDDSDGKGIYRHKEEVERIQDTLCATLKHPTTIIDNVRELNFINSARAGFTLNRSCDLFRRCVDFNLCEKCDSQHASLLLKENIGADELQQSAEDAILSTAFTMGDEFNIYHETTDELPDIQHAEESDRIYLEYCCPIMGLRELIIPLIIETKVVGVFFVGQFIIETDIERINRIRSTALKKYEQKLIECVGDKIDIELIKKRILTVYNKDDILINKLFTPYSAKSNNLLNIGARVFKDTTEFDNVIKEEILPAVRNKEAEIADYLHNKRKRFVDDTIKKAHVILNNVTEDIHAKFNNTSIYILVEELLQEFKDGIEKPVAFIVKELDLVELEFVIKNSIDEKFSKKEAGISIRCTNDTYKDEFEGSILKTNHFGSQEYPRDQTKPNPHIITTCDTEGDCNDNNFELYGFIQGNQNNIDVLLNWNTTQPFVFSVKYPTKNEIMTKNRVRAAICIGIHRLFVNIVHELTLLDTMLTAEINERVLRLYRHEITHLTLGLAGGTYFTRDVDRFRGLTDNKLSDIHQDNESCIQQLNYMTQNIGIFTNSIDKKTIKKGPFYIFKDIFWKWDSLYKHDLWTKRLHLTMPDVSLDDKNRPLLISDKERVEQIIYNLLNNAIKYSHINSNVYIDCKLRTGERTRQCLSIIDYGNEITNDQEIPYRLYYRDPALINKKIEGTGVGLFIVKKTVELLNVTIQHHCELISKYNVSLFDKYLACVKNHHDNLPIQSEKILEEREKLKLRGVYETIVNKAGGYIETKTLITEILNPTYKVTFEVIL